MCSLAFSYISPAHANKTKPDSSTGMAPIYQHPIYHNGTESANMTKPDSSTGMAPVYEHPAHHNDTDIVHQPDNSGHASEEKHHDDDYKQVGEHHDDHHDDADEKHESYGEHHDDDKHESYDEHHDDDDKHDDDKHDDVAGHHDDYNNNDYNNNDHKSSHESEPIQWEEEDCDDQSADQDDDCNDESSSQDDNNKDESNKDKKKVNWRDIIEDEYEGAGEEIYNNAKDVLHSWGLLSAKSASSSSDRYGDSNYGDNNGNSNSYDDCTMTEFDYNSRSCKAYGMFDNAEYNETQTAYTRSKGLMAISEPLYMTKSELNGRTLGQLGVHFAMCEEYNKKSGAQFRLGLYEKQRKSSSSSYSHGSKKSESWSLVAKTPLQKFNRRSDEFAMFAVDVNSTIALKPNTYYTIITTMAPGSSLTMYTNDADASPFSSFDFKNTANNLPATWNGKKSRNWSAVSMELAMCRSKTKK